MSDLDYWEEIIADGMAEAGVKANSEQIGAIAKLVSDAHESYGLAFRQPPAQELPVFAELKAAKEKLDQEQSKVVCKECNGTGGYWRGRGCWKCNGEGRHL